MGISLLLLLSLLWRIAVKSDIIYARDCKSALSKPSQELGALRCYRITGHLPLSFAELRKKKKKRKKFLRRGNCTVLQCNFWRRCNFLRAEALSLPVEALSLQKREMEYCSLITANWVGPFAGIKNFGRRKLKQRQEANELWSRTN